MELRMSAPLAVRFERRCSEGEAAANGWCILGEPAFIALQRVGLYPRTVSGVASQLGQGPLQSQLQAAAEAAARLEGAGLTKDELMAVLLCVGGSSELPGSLLPQAQEETWFAAMNRFLASRHGQAHGERTGASRETEKLWEVFLADLTAGLTALRLRQEELTRCFRLCWVPQQLLDQLAAAKGDPEQILCFEAVQSVSRSEPWRCLELLPQGCAPCLLDFDERIARVAVDVSLAAGSEAELLLPAFLRAQVVSLEKEQAPAPYHFRVFRLKIAGFRETECSLEQMHSPPEAVLAASLLLGLQRSRASEEDVKDSALHPEEHAELDANTRAGFEGTLSVASQCFSQLAECVQVRSCEGSVGSIWKGYLECALDGSNPWKELGSTLQLGAFGIARTAALGGARASLRVTKRALGFQSCLDQEAMDKEFQSQVQALEARLSGAVACARQEVSSLALETLTDPEAFLRFLAHDPIRALKAAPLILQVYERASAAQRVLLFSKLIALAAMVAAFLRGDDSVLRAFEGPFPVTPLNHWQCLLCESEEATAAQQAQSVAGRVALLRLHLARLRLLVVAGVPDAGKTTLLREVFGLGHLKAGLCEEGRTDEVLFELHPEGDLRYRPVYLVDTPGFGDGEQLHRNDMGRLLLHGCECLASNVTLLWVLRAGRHTKDDAYRFVSGIAESTQRLVVLVTHMDKLFEERYREAGPRWRDGILQGVPVKDPRWKSQRRLLMQELRSEVESTVLRTLTQLPELLFACLGGWMAAREDEEDEFAEVAPWPWAREELTEFFGILGPQELRGRLDARLMGGF